MAPAAAAVADPDRPAEDEDEEVIIEELDASAVMAAAEGDGGAAAEEAPSASEGKEEDPSIDTAMTKIENEKKTMTAVEKLERSKRWKAQGNEEFKKDEIFKAADSYYHAIMFSRELTYNPQYYPKLGHNAEQRKEASDLCESVFTNIALVQTKYGATLPADHPERPKVYQEAVKSATEALKLNAKNVKAAFRRAVARASLAGADRTDEALELLGEARADLMAVLEEDANNRDARATLKDVLDRVKAIKKYQVENEKKQFSFGSSLSALAKKEKDLAGDGSVRKVIVSDGDGGKWFNEDWLLEQAPTRCTVGVCCAMLSSGGAAGLDRKCDAPAVSLSFALGDADMHEGIRLAVRSMTVGEVAKFTFAPSRISAKGSLADLLPKPRDEVSVWEITMGKFVTWADLNKDGERLQKIQDEGYGKFPEPLAEVFLHWRLLGPDGNVLHSSRYTVHVGAEGSSGIKHVEDEDKPPARYVVGEQMWQPLAILCRSLRQGGVGELRMREMPPMPKEEAEGGGAAAQLSLMLNKAKGTEKLRHCTVRAELERVVLPLTGPEDPRWEGSAALVEERFRGEQLLERGEELAGLVRLERVVRWAEQLEPEERSKMMREHASARASIGWVLASRAAPVLDAGNVTSTVLSAAQADVAEAEAQCKWLEEKCPGWAGTRLLKAKILAVQDDDFEGAHRELLEAQRSAPDDKRVQEELRRVKVELRKVEEAQSRGRVAELRDRLKRARTEGAAASREAAVLELLRQLSDTKCSWDTVMETRIGVELKACQEGFGDEAKQLCGQILGRFKDESKEQRPMWEG